MEHFAAARGGFFSGFRGRDRAFLPEGRGSGGVPPVVLHVRAPVSQVWRVVGEEWADVHRILPSLSGSRLLTPGGPRVGARRACTLAKPVMGLSSVVEEVEAWEEGRGFTYAVASPPWPMAGLRNRWTLEPEGSGTRLTLAPSMTLRGGAATRWLAPLVLAMLSRSLRADLPQMVAAIERACAEPRG